MRAQAFSTASRLINQAPTAVSLPRKLCSLIDREDEEGDFRVFFHKSLSDRKDVQVMFSYYSILIVPGAKDAYEQMLGNP